LVVGGRTHDESLNPHISTIVTEEVYLNEPVFNSAGFYPERIVAINRLATIDQGVLQRLVVVPGQFKSVSGTVPTTGTQRLWDEVDVVVYYTPFTNTDYAQPVFWQVGTVTDTSAITFTAIVSDDVGVQRVLVLYRQQGASQWQSFDLQQISGALWRKRLSLGGVIEYIVQAVDTAGNVAQVTNYGNPFVTSAGRQIFLPLVVR
jgi:hypothetical protein